MSPEHRARIMLTLAQNAPLVLADLPADARQHDRLLMSDERCGCFVKQDRVIRGTLADFR